MKRVFIIVGSISVLVVVTLGIIYIQSKRRSSGVPVAENNPLLTPAASQLVTWDDPAGFTFTYHGNLSTDKHDEDQENYAHVELTQSAHPGNIIVWAKDTTAADVTAWVRTEKAFKNANIVDTTLGGQPAKKIILTSPRKSLIVGAIYDELLFMIESEASDSAYWTPVYQGIVDSFQFKPIETSEDSGGSEDQVSEEAVDEEEVVE